MRGCCRRARDLAIATYACFCGAALVAFAGLPALVEGERGAYAHRLADDFDAAYSFAPVQLPLFILGMVAANEAVRTRPAGRSSRKRPTPMKSACAAASLIDA